MTPLSAKALFAAVLVLPLACVQAKTRGEGARPLKDDASAAPADAAKSIDTAVSPADRPILPDAAAPPPDASEVDVGSVAADATPRDMTADADPCGCGPEGLCSDGVCVCAPGFCNEGMFFTDPAGVWSLAASSSALLYVANNEVKKVDLATRQVSSLYGRKQGALGVGSVAVDAHDTIYWCRDAYGDGADRFYDLMRNDQLLETGFCGPYSLRFTDTDVYVSDGNNVYRRRLDRAGRDTVVKGPGIDSFAVGGNYLYYSSSLRGLYRVHRVNLADGSQRELFDPGFDQFQLLRVALDERHLYITGDVGIWKLPLAGGPPGPLIAPDQGRAIAGVALSKTHVYWSSEDPAGCETRFYRCPKSGESVELLATLPGRCNTSFVLQGSHIYLQTSNEVGTGPGVVYRLRQ